MRNDTGGFDEIMRLTSARRGDSASSYDFRKTEKFSSDQQKYLDHIFVQFAEQVILHLGPVVETRLNLSLTTMQPRHYHEYLNSLAPTTPIVVFKVDQNVTGFIDIDVRLAFALFERLMGGKGTMPRPDFREKFTDLEQAILKRPLTKLLDAYTAAWQTTQKAIKTQLVKIAYNPMAVHIASPSELMVVIPFQTELSEANGLINVLLPFRYLRDITPKTSYDEFVLTQSGGAAPASANAGTQAGLSKKLESTRVPIAVTLGQAELLFQELMTIEVGDTIRLDTEIAQPLRVKVNDKTKFLGHPGVKDGKLACKISTVLKEGDEEFDE